MENEKKDSGGNQARKDRGGEGGGGGEVEMSKVKKPFDKKTYRLKKYSNKYKVEQWEERRRKGVIRRFYKDTRQQQKKPTDNRVEDSSERENLQERTSEENGTTIKKDAYHAAKNTCRRKQDEIKEWKAAALLKRIEKSEALKKYKVEKASKYKKLCKKTRKGQPVMKDRLEMLLEKIQETT